MGDALAEAEEWIGTLDLERPRPFAPSDEDPRAFLWWLLRMASHTHTRAREPLPPLDPGLLSVVSAALGQRPPEDPDHAQLCIDPASTARRAMLVRDRARGDGPILAVGDDDGVSLALALLGTRAAAVDLDPRILGWLRERAAAAGVPVDVAQIDVFDDGPPSRLLHACSAVVTDPARSYDDCVAFLGFGARCLAPGGALVWADHPDWNFEHDAVVRTLPELGLECEEVVELVHAYPLSPPWLPDADAKAAELGVRPEWLAELFARTRAWTHAYVLRSIA